MLVPIFVQPICITLLLWHNYSAPLKHRCNWCQPPLPANRRPLRANGGAPIPAPANVGPSIPPQSHPRPIRSVRPMHLVSIQFLPLYQPAHKNTVSPSEPNTNTDTIQPIQSRWSIQYDPASVLSEGNSPTRPSIIRKTHPQLPQLPQHPYIIPYLLLMPPHLIFHPTQQPLPPDIWSLPLMLYLLLPSLLRIDIAPSPTPIFWPF